MVSRTSRLYTLCKQKSEVMQLDISVPGMKSQSAKERADRGRALSKANIGIGRSIKAGWLSRGIVGRTTVAKLSGQIDTIGCYAFPGAFRERFGLRVSG